MSIVWPLSIHDVVCQMWLAKILVVNHSSSGHSILSEAHRWWVETLFTKSRITESHNLFKTSTMAFLSHTSERFHGSTTWTFDDTDYMVRSWLTTLHNWKLTEIIKLEGPEMSGWIKNALMINFVLSMIIEIFQDYPLSSMST